MKLLLFFAGDVSMALEEVRKKLTEIRGKRLSQAHQSPTPTKKVIRVFSQIYVYGNYSNKFVQYKIIIFPTFGSA
jgi:hypothetical protein